MPFQVGNTLRLGQKQTKPYFSAAIRKHMARNPDAALRVVQSLFSAAEAGDVAAARELADRIEGKAVARTELSGANGAALFPVVAITVVGVDADDCDAIESTASHLDEANRLAHDQSADTLLPDDENVA